MGSRREASFKFKKENKKDRREKSAFYAFIVKFFSRRKLRPSFMAL